MFGEVNSLVMVWDKVHRRFAHGVQFGPTSIRFIFLNHGHIFLYTLLKLRKKPKPQMLI
jgi:hypothetical protein